MRYRIKTETFNNGTQYFTAQVCYTPPYTGWFKCFDTTIWCSITNRGNAHNEAYCGRFLSEVCQLNEEAALQCIEAFKQRLAKEIGEQIQKTEYKYL